MFYSQRDSKWKQVRLGTCYDTIGQSGCFMTSLANLAWKVPVDVNALFTKKGGYVNGCLIDPFKAAALLNLEYGGKVTKKPNVICIAETNYYAKQGVPQHFFIWNPDGRIADPLDMNPNWQQNLKKYPIVSYRLFRLKTQPSASTEATQPLDAPRDSSTSTPTPALENPSSATVSSGVKNDSQIENKNAPAAHSSDSSSNAKSLFGNLLDKLKKWL